MAKKIGAKFVALCSVAVGAVYAAGYVVTNKPVQSLAATMPQSQSSTASQGQGTSSGLPGQSSAPQFPPQGGFVRHHHHDGDGYGRDGGYGSGDDGEHDGYGSGYGGYGSGSGYGGSGSGQFGGSAGFAGSSGSSAGSSGMAGSSGAGSSGSSSGQGTTTSQSKTAPASQKYVDGTYNGSGSNRIGMVSVAVTITSGKIADVQITQCYTHYPQSYIDPVLPQQVVSTQSATVNNISGATLSTEDFQTAVLQALSQAQNPNYKG